MEIEETTIEDITRALDLGRTTSEHLVAEYLERIDNFDRRGPAIRSIISINQDALRQAQALDRHFKTHGRMGPLHGIPVMVKDNFDATGTATTVGSLAFQTYQPVQDSCAVRRLRAAGAIILGKANLHEFAIGGTTHSSLGGQTRNPYDLSRTPGGSSGGTGAAVTANFCVIGMGSDTVNSVRSPASAMNLVGLRPTRGLVSRAGVFPVSPTQDAIGPITRSVADAARTLDVIAGYDKADSATAWNVDKLPGRYAEGLNGYEIKGIRIGVCCDFFGDGSDYSEVSGVVMNAIGILEKAGARLVELRNVGIDIALLNSDLDLQKLEYKKSINRYLSDIGDASPIKTLHQLKQSEDIRDPALREFFRDADRVDPVADAAEYNRRLAAIHQLRQRLMTLMAEYDVHVLAYPLQKRLVVPIGVQAQADRNGILAALTGFPAIDVPAGFSSPSGTAPVGIPIGMDLLGRPWSEHLLLKVAHAFEKLAATRRLPPHIAAA